MTPDLVTEKITTDVVTGASGRDAVIIKVKAQYLHYLVECRRISAVDGENVTEVLHTAKRDGYVHAYGIAEAWAWRGEVPE